MGNEIIINQISALTREIISCDMAFGSAHWNSPYAIRAEQMKSERKGLISELEAQGFTVNTNDNFDLFAGWPGVEVRHA